uniref:Uncharacterized protein n=1 Tax=Anguilla anguilla TaxID=7936 RepID=A0A0E9UGR7_ANGAN
MKHLCGIFHVNSLFLNNLAHFMLHGIVFIDHTF